MIDLSNFVRYSCTDFSLKLVTLPLYVYVKLLTSHLCIETKLRILNGRVDGDSLGYNTYYSPRGSSNVDYFLASEDIFHDLQL